MRIAYLIFALLDTRTSGADNLRASEIKIIANRGIDTSEISRDDLHRIFLITKTSLPGVSHVEPVLENRGAVFALFAKEYIGRTNSALLTYYRGLMFTGKASIPRSFGSDSEVAEYVAKTKGAIGFVGIAANTASVKVLKVTP
jgi:hypothetical protein